MKKPKWWIYVRFRKNFSLRPYTYMNKRLLWKDKFETPRIELIPRYMLTWLWFTIEIVQGDDDDWEWYLWVMEYSNNDLQKAIKTYPWKRQDASGKFVKQNPHLNYNKRKPDE